MQQGTTLDSFCFLLFNETKNEVDFCFNCVSNYYSILISQPLSWIKFESGQARAKIKKLEMLKISSSTWGAKFLGCQPCHSLYGSANVCQAMVYINIKYKYKYKYKNEIVRSIDYWDLTLMRLTMCILKDLICKARNEWITQVYLTETSWFSFYI